LTMRNLISDLRVAVAGVTLNGLDSEEARRVVETMDSDALVTARDAMREKLRAYQEENEASHREGRAALEAEGRRRADQGITEPIKMEDFLNPPLDRYADKWRPLRAEMSRYPFRLYLIELELRRRFHRGDVPEALATDVKALRRAERESKAAAERHAKTRESAAVVKALEDLQAAREAAEEAARSLAAERARIVADWNIDVPAEA
jgi:hypothetical protein